MFNFVDMKTNKVIQLIVILLIGSMYSCIEEDIDISIPEPTKFEDIRLFYNIYNKDMPALGWENNQKKIPYLSTDAMVLYMTLEGEYSGDYGVFVNKIVVTLDIEKSNNEILKMIELELLKGMDKTELLCSSRDSLYIFGRGIECFEVSILESTTTITIIPLVGLISVRNK